MRMSLRMRRLCIRLLAVVEHRYRISESHIIDTRVEHLNRELDRPTLSLVTCYPFDAVVPGGPLRFVAVAEEIEPEVLLREL
jgi:sortase (surface protein transpeptidase)